MSIAVKRTMTEAEYLAFEATSPAKHEFLNGEVFAMAGVSEAHSIVQGNALVALSNRLRGTPCRAHTSDLRVAISETGLYAYPDVSVVCGQAAFSESNPPSLLNPTVIVEVLSESTEGYDLGPKAAHYRHRSSVRALLFVDSRRRWAQLQVRNGDGTWTLSDQTDGVVQIAALELTLTLDELYEGVPVV